MRKMMRKNLNLKWKYLMVSLEKILILMNKVIVNWMGMSGKKKRLSY